MKRLLSKYERDQSNLVDLLKDQGIKVLSIALANYIDRFTAQVIRNQGKATSSVIVVNRKQWGERQRFTIAHELGHMVLDVLSSMNEE